MHEAMLQKTEQKKETGVERFVFFILIMKGKKTMQLNKSDNGKSGDIVIKQAFNKQKTQIVRFHWV